MKLCDVLENESCSKKEFNVFPMVKHCALHIICETAMGKRINDKDGNDTTYVKAVEEASKIIINRWWSPWLHNDTIFNLTPTGSRLRDILSTMHEFSNKIIQEKKSKNNNNLQDSKDSFGIKKKKAFLDLLIEASQDGKVIDDNGLKEEVHSFMFAGK